MDFKSLIQKIESLDDSIVTPKAPTLPKSIQLSEDAQMRVLAGQTTILAEAASAKKDAAKEKQKVASAKKPAKKPATKKVVAKKAIDDTVEDESPKSKKSAKNESAEYDSFTLRFMNMVESRKSKKKKPDADGDGVPDWADTDSEKSKSSKKKPAAKKSSGPAKKGLTPKQESSLERKRRLKKVTSRNCHSKT